MSFIQPSETLGADLRSLRKTRSMTLEELAKCIGKSVGWLSQVERDISKPTCTDLADIASALDVPMSILYAKVNIDPDESGLVVRKTHRRAITQHTVGLAEELLSPDLTDDFEVVHSTFAPGSFSETPKQRPTQEVGYIVSGKLELVIGDKSFSLTAGDSFRIRGETFQWANPHADPCVAIWIISPPVY